MRLLPSRPSRTTATLVFALLVATLGVHPVMAQPRAPAPAGTDDELVSLDFNDVELPVVVDTIWNDWVTYWPASKSNSATDMKIGFASPGPV